MRIFVNATPLDVPAGTDVQRAVAVHDAGLAAQVAAGTAFVTDARGIELPGAAPLEAGSILRVVVRARRGAGSADDDA
jgi:hypothetical protein